VILWAVARFKSMGPSATGFHSQADKHKRAHYYIVCPFMLISCPTCCVSCLSLWQNLKLEFTWNDLLFWAWSVWLDVGPLLK
jgi:hypothetical protein